MRLEGYRPDHFEIIAAWWKAWDGTVLSPDILPPTGVVVTGPDPIAASFCYLSNAAIAHIAFTVADPSVRVRPMLRAVEMAIGGARDIARRELGGEGFIWATTHTPAMHRILCRMGFTDGGPANTSFVLLSPIDTRLIT